MSRASRSIRIHQLVLEPGPVPDLGAAVAVRLDVDIEDVLAVRLLRESVDGRRRPPVRIASVEAEIAGGARVLARFRGDPSVIDASAPQ